VRPESSVMFEPLLLASLLVGAVVAVIALAGPWTISVALNLAACALEVAALVCLFRDGAKAWPGGEQPANPATFH
jgi:hypothetical protein